MSPATFLDANVPIYAAGRNHENKTPCARIMLMAADRPDVFVSDVEILQELMHRYMAAGRWAFGRDVLRVFVGVMRNRLEPVLVEDVEVASGLADEHRGIGARDLLHAAVMRRLGVQRIISADRDFDRLPGVIRLDPADVEAWETSVLS